MRSKKTHKVTEWGWATAADGLTVKRLDPAAFLLLICQVTMTHTELFLVGSLSKVLRGELFLS